MPQKEDASCDGMGSSLGADMRISLVNAKSLLNYICTIIISVTHTYGI